MDNIILKQYHIIANVRTSPVFMVIRKTYEKSTIGNILVLIVRTHLDINIYKKDNKAVTPMVPLITATERIMLWESLSS